MHVRPPPLSTAETALLLAVLAAAALAMFGPAVALPLAPHDFAERRHLAGVPHALDVLSNLGFAAFGIRGLAVLRGTRTGLPAATRRLAGLFFLGLLLTAAGSAGYHWSPDDMGLALDRLGMGVAFAGVLGLAAAGRVSERAGWALAGAVLLAAPIAIAAALAIGQIRPWAVLQGGGMLLVAALALRRPRPGGPAVRLGLLIGLYALAKLCELADHAIFEATSGVVSGHSLKHLVASGAAWPVLAVLRQPVASLRSPALRHDH